MKAKFKAHDFVRPDYYFDSLLVQRLVNRILKKGKKVLAWKIAKLAILHFGKLLKLNKKEDIVSAFEEAVTNLYSEVELGMYIRGGRKVPHPKRIEKKRSSFLAFEWLLEDADIRRKKIVRIFKKPKMIFAYSLAFALQDAYNKVGYAMKKKQELYKKAEASRSSARF